MHVPLFAGFCVFSRRYERNGVFFEYVTLEFVRMNLVLRLRKFSFAFLRRGYMADAAQTPPLSSQAGFHSDGESVF